MKPVDIYSFECTGVAIIRDAISQGTVRRVRECIDKHWPNGVPWKFPILHLDRVFWELMTHPDVLKMSAEFAGDHFRLDHAFGLTSNGAIPQLHGGPQSSQMSCFYQQLGHGPKKSLVGQLNFGFCIYGQDSTTGGFCYVPGSHKVNDSRDGRTVLTEIYQNSFNHPSIIVPRLHAGDLLVFTEALIHGDSGWSHPNGFPRRQIYYKITPGFMCWRDPAENQKYEQFAQTPLERNMIRPPWTGRYSETETSMGFNNTRRDATIPS